VPTAGATFCGTGPDIGLAADALGSVRAPTALLLQGYDEYVVAYSDTKFAFNVAGTAPPPGQYTENMMFHPIVVDSQVIGFWRRTAKPKTIAIDLDLLADLTSRQRRALDEELGRYEAFAGLPLTVSWV
jgi:hypothetical protein